MVIVGIAKNTGEMCMNDFLIFGDSFLSKLEFGLRMQKFTL